mgnify:CR=1 FL=1
MKSICILPGDNPDPTILRVGNTYYLTCSSLSYYPGLLLYKSDDLKSFKPVCRILTENLGDIWAPELVSNNGKYYIYFPAHDPKTGYIRDFVVWSENIESGWSEPIEIGITYQIDPGFVTDGTKSWLYFNNSMCAQLTSDLLHLAEKPIKRNEPWEYPKEWETQQMNDESPKLFKKNGYYYMITAEGGTAGPATSHMAVCFRSKSPLGPWEISPYNPVIHTYSADEKWWSTGHATYFEDYDGNGYFVFHGYKKDNQNMGRQILLCKARWTDDGFPVAEEIDGEDTVYPDFYDDFKSETLGLDWCFYREFDKDRISTGNGLNIKGKGNGIADSCPLTLNGRFENYEFEAGIDRIDNDTGAGIAVFYNEKAYIGLYVENGSIMIADESKEDVLCKTGVSDVRFKIVKKAQTITLFVFDGGKWLDSGKSVDITDFQHNVLKKFLSARPCLCAFGSGNAHFTDVAWRNTEIKK